MSNPHSRTQTVRSPSMIRESPSPSRFQSPRWRLRKPGRLMENHPARHRAGHHTARPPLRRAQSTPTRATLAAGIASEEKSAPKTAAAWARPPLLHRHQPRHVQRRPPHPHRYLRHWPPPSSRAETTTAPVIASSHKLRHSRRASGSTSIPPPPSGRPTDTTSSPEPPLIAGGRRNVWSPSHKRWSEAALAIDSQGRLLFLFSAPPTPCATSTPPPRAPLDIQQAIAPRRRPRSHLSIHVPAVDLDLCGSYETGFLEDESNKEQWPLRTDRVLRQGDEIAPATLRYNSGLS